MMFRLKIMLIVFAVMLLIFGVMFLVGDWNASAMAVPVRLADIEREHSVPNKHVSVGEHIALYPECTYAIKLKKGEFQARPNAKIGSVYYPIISKDHSFLASGDENSTLDSFAVLVRSNRIGTQQQIPALPRLESTVTGSAVVGLSRLNLSQKKAILQRFPGLDEQRVIIIQEGRKPIPPIASCGMLLGGLALLALGIAALKQGQPSVPEFSTWTPLAAEIKTEADE